MNNQNNPIPLSVEDTLQKIILHDKEKDSITVYRKGEGYPNYGHFVFCGLIPETLVKQMLVEKSYINQVIEDARFTPYVDSDGQYQRFGAEGEKHNFEPLVIHRECQRQNINTVEIAQDFRLYHNLYHHNNTYIDENGQGVAEIIQIEGGYEVQIQLDKIRAYLKDKRLYLSLLFEVNDYYNETLMDMDETEDIQWDSNTEELIYYKHQYRDAKSFSDFPTNRYIRGRRFIPPAP